jgi:hypothetical protein
MNESQAVNRKEVASVSSYHCGPPVTASSDAEGSGFHASPHKSEVGRCGGGMTKRSVVAAAVLMWGLASGVLAAQNPKGAQVTPEEFEAELGYQSGTIR